MTVSSQFLKLLYVDWKWSVFVCVGVCVCRIMRNGK